jgi:hypothetical protein
MTDIKPVFVKVQAVCCNLIADQFADNIAITHSEGAAVLHRLVNLAVQGIKPLREQQLRVQFGFFFPQVRLVP